MYKLNKQSFVFFLLARIDTHWTWRRVPIPWNNKRDWETKGVWCFQQTNMWAEQLKRKSIDFWSPLNFHNFEKLVEPVFLLQSIDCWHWEGDGWWNLTSCRKSYHFHFQCFFPNIFGLGSSSSPHDTQFAKGKRWWKIRIGAAGSRWFVSPVEKFFEFFRIIVNGCRRKH